MEVIVPDSSRIYSGSGVVESKSVGTFSPSQKQDSHRGLLVDRGVGSPRLVKSASASTFTVDLRMDTETKVRKKMYLKKKNSLTCEDCIIQSIAFSPPFPFKLLEFNAGGCWSCCSCSCS